MNTTLPDGLLSRLSEFVDSRMALHFPRSRWGELGCRACSAAGEMGSADPVSFIEELIATRATSKQMDMLASHLTIGETYFWREPRLFDAFEGEILPELIRLRGRSDRRLRIWCAGCSTGEEAYSIAIALRRAEPPIDERGATILATDINLRMLGKAKAGIYGEWSFRDAPPWLGERFFMAKAEGKREVVSEIRRMVSFEYLNLAEDVFPSPLNDTNAMDIVFCRNVLMYFSAARARLIVDKLRRSLVEGGWLIVSACECSQALFSDFSSIQFPGATGYRKSSDPPPADELSPLEPNFIVEAPHQAPPLALTMAPSVRELADAGRLTEALASCEAAIAADKLDPRLHQLRASILQELGREEEAIASLKRSIYLDPESAPTYFILGNLALRNGDTKMGRRCLANALSLLAERPDEDILPDSDGLTVGRFREIISATIWIYTEAI
jgi:chemotaxis protein methyltransferase CheR